MTNLIFVYITTPTHTEAEAIGRVLVEERLAACVNILAPVRSLYRWEGEVQSAEETVLIAKTQAALFDSLAARARALHSAACPCLVALPVAEGTPDFLDWIRQATSV